MDRENLRIMLCNLAQKAKELNLPASSVQMVNMVATTEPKMNKGGRGGNSGGYYGRVKVRHSVGGVIGTFWGKIVNNFIRKHEVSDSEADIQPRKWGTRIEGESLVEHTTKEGETRYYLEYFPLRYGQVQYLVDGREATPEEVKQFKPYIVESKKESDVKLENGQVATIPVFLRDYRLDHIDEIKMMGEIITVNEDNTLVIHHRDGTREVVGIVAK